MVSRAKIEACLLRIPQSKADDVEAFFTRVLGMSLRKSTATVRVFAPFADTVREAACFPQLEAGGSLHEDATQSCDVAFQLVPDAESAPPQSDTPSIYWKIGLATDDVDAFAGQINRLAAEHTPQLAEAGVVGRVGKGSQFLDIGYLTHLRDPAGFTIELLQTTFEQSSALRKQLITERAAAAGLTSTSVGPGALAVGQITTRITDPKASLAFYQDVLGMRLLSVQPVTPHRFTLYFLAWTDEQPPAQQDVEAVENREWCWQRPYTTLELQHSWDKSGGTGTAYAVPPACQAPAFDSVAVTVADRALFDGIKARLGVAGTAESSLQCADPDGLPIAVTLVG